MAKAKPSRGQQKSSGRPVTLSVKAEGAQNVIVVGDFNNWEEAGIPLRPMCGGCWETTLTLRPGEYQYRLKIDGEWRDHPEAQKRVPNPYGSENCVLVVS